MSTRAFQISLIAALSLFFLSGCGIFKQQSKRYISTTHWGEMGGGAFAQKQQPAPEPEAKNAVEKAAEESAGTNTAEGATEEGAEASADAATPNAAQQEAAQQEAAQQDAPQEVASTGNVGGTAQMSGGDENMTLYIAYYEHITTENMLNGETSTAAVKSHLRICQLQEDNSLQCSENPELQKMLNPHMQQR